MPWIAVGNSVIRYGGGGASWDVAANAPILLTATAISDTQIDLAWTDNSSNESSYSIERSTDGITCAEIDTVAADVVTYSDITCIANTLYYYRVRAFKN